MPRHTPTPSTAPPHDPVAAKLAEAAARRGERENRWRDARVRDSLWKNIKKRWQRVQDFTTADTLSLAVELNAIRRPSYRWDLTDRALHARLARRLVLFAGALTRASSIDNQDYKGRLTRLATEDLEDDTDERLARALAVEMYGLAFAGDEIKIVAVLEQAVRVDPAVLWPRLRYWVCEDLPRALLFDEQIGTEGQATGPDPPEDIESAGSATPQTERRKRMSVLEAGAAGRRLVDREGKAFTSLSRRQQAKRVGCAYGTWQQTRICEEIHPRKKPGGAGVSPPQGSGPHVVSLTDKIEATQGVGGRDHVLNEVCDQEDREQLLSQLIQEQNADQRHDPNPLDDDPPGAMPRRAVSKKQL
jgi:hypothetical protein